MLVNPAFGSRFWSADNVRHARAYQDIDVSAYAGRIDQGDVLANLTASIVSDHIANVSAEDRGWFELVCYNGSGNEIGRSKSRAAATSLGSWTPKNVLLPVPPGTRTIRRKLEAWLTDGAALNVCWDIDSLTLYAPEVGTPPDPDVRRRNAAMMIG